MLFAFCSAWAAGPAQSHVVAPKSGLMIVYLRPQELYFPKLYGKLANSYSSVISSLSINSTVLGALQSTADNTSWITRMERGRFLSGGRGKIDMSQYRQLVSNGSHDAIVVLESVVELTSNLKGLMVVARVIVQRVTPLGPIELKHRDITVTISLEHSGQPLSVGQLASIHKGNLKAAGKARAAIWFAYHGNRLRTGLLLDLTTLIKTLRAFLSSPI